MTLSSASFIDKVELSGEDIQKLIYTKLGPACEGERMDLAILSMLTLSILLMKPDISVEKLQETVMGTSEYLMLALTDEKELGIAN